MHNRRSKLRRLLAGPPLAVLLASMLLSHTPVALGPVVPGWTPPARPAPQAGDRTEFALTLLSAPARPAQGGWKDPADPAATAEDDPLVLVDQLSWSMGGSFGGSEDDARRTDGPRWRGSGGRGFGSAGGWVNGSGDGGSGGGGSGGGGSGSGGSGGWAAGGEPGSDGAGLTPPIEIADTQPAEPGSPEFSLPGENGGNEPETPIVERNGPELPQTEPGDGAGATAVPEPAGLALLGMALLALAAARRLRAP